MGETVDAIKVIIGETSAFGRVCADELKARGFLAVTLKKDANAILKAIENESPDVVVIDAVMPKLSAVELIKRVNESTVKKPEFIIISAFDNPIFKQESIKSGAAFFMLKPFNLELLITRIITLIDNKNSTSENCYPFGRLSTN